MNAITRLLILLAVCSAFTGGGCKKKDTAGGAAGASGSNDRGISNDLKVIGLAFLNYCDTTKNNPFASPVPTDVNALDNYMRDAPAVLKAVKDGHYKVFWGAPATQQIIACEKDAETKGGWVCMRFGDAQKKTAAEIQQELAKK